MPIASMYYGLAFFFLMLVSVDGGSYEIDDRIFSISYMPKVEDDLLREDANVIHMVTKDNEAFDCILPKLEEAILEPTLAEGESSSEESPYDLMAGAFDKPCVYKVGVYWTYEYCHGSTISQFHASRLGETPGEIYFLGRTKKADVKNNLESLDLTRRPTLRLNNEEDVPYLEITMFEGTKCDLNNLPRSSRVRFVCSVTAEYKFLSVQETSTCEYEVIIGFASLCKHPYFKTKESFLSIQCHASSSEVQSPKPKGLLDLERENNEIEKMKAKMEFFFVKQSGSVELLIKPVDSEFVPSQPEVKGSSQPDLWRPSRPEPLRPLSDPDIVERFLMGDSCIYGGLGWWKNEFCYGKSVKQYHEEKGSPRVEITLGLFDMESHLNWINAHPGKKPKKTGRGHVSHFYSGGDFCEESGAKRHVEVKLKCKKSSSLSPATIYLLEPATCEYVLVVESSLICDVLHLADEETGLMNLDKKDFIRKPQDDDKILVFPLRKSQSIENEENAPENPLNHQDGGDGMDYIFDNIQDQLEQAGQNFMDKQKWIDGKERFLPENKYIPEEIPKDNQKGSSSSLRKELVDDDDKAMTQEEQDALDSVLINSVREAKHSYENILNNIQDQLEQAGVNFMEKQKWLGDKDPLDYEDEEEENDPQSSSRKDEL